jgi:tRNA-specific 2-thiouridylase
VVAYALREIRAGRTPNSDLLCNSKIKFGRFFEKIGSGYDLVASGHYAGKTLLDGREYLTRAKDPLKDQTYFLAHLDYRQLQQAIFPLGPYLKTEVRALAREFALPNQSRRDSQGICFLGQIKYHDFVRYHLGEKAGDLINFETGERVGRHRGYWFYTIGQRRGIELSGGPWYVVKKDVQNNLVYISNSYHDPSKKRDSFSLTDLHWISGPPTAGQLASLQVKIRHGERSYRARLQTVSDREVTVWIEGNDQGFAAGQFAVFYSGELCMGCGTILG